MQPLLSSDSANEAFDDVEADEAAMSRMRHPCCSPNPLEVVLVRLGFSSVASTETESPEWRAAVDNSWWYQMSSFAYCGAGGLLLLRPEPIAPGLGQAAWPPPARQRSGVNHLGTLSGHVAVPATP